MNVQRNLGRIAVGAAGPAALVAASAVPAAATSVSIPGTVCTIEAAYPVSHDGITVYGGAAIICPNNPAAMQNPHIIVQLQRKNVYTYEFENFGAPTTAGVLGYGGTWYGAYASAQICSHDQHYRVAVVGYLFYGQPNQKSAGFTGPEGAAC